MTGMAQVFCKSGDSVIELNPDDELFFRFAGVPGRTVTVQALTSLMGDDNIYAEAVSRTYPLPPAD